MGRDSHTGGNFGIQVVARSGSHAENFYGENITIESNCQISGALQYTGGLRMNEHVSLVKTPQKVDTLPF
jgi:hypothetical protein